MVDILIMREGQNTNNRSISRTYLKMTKVIINNSEYLPHIELILLDYLSKQQDQVACLTINDMFLLLYMVNRNYR